MTSHDETLKESSCRRWATAVILQQVWLTHLDGNWPAIHSGWGFAHDNNLEEQSQMRPLSSKQTFLRGGQIEAWDYLMTCPLLKKTVLHDNTNTLILRPHTLFCLPNRQLCDCKMPYIMVSSHCTCSPRKGSSFLPELLGQCATPW
jgi:hypothetical protein